MTFLAWLKPRKKWNTKPAAPIAKAPKAEPIFAPRPRSAVPAGPTPVQRDTTLDTLTLLAVTNALDTASSCDTSTSSYDSGSSCSYDSGSSSSYGGE